MTKDLKTAGLEESGARDSIGRRLAAPYPLTRGLGKGQRNDQEPQKTNEETVTKGLETAGLEGEWE